MQCLPHKGQKCSSQPGLSTGVLKGTKERRDTESFWKRSHSPGMWGVTVSPIPAKARSGSVRMHWDGLPLLLALWSQLSSLNT